MLPSSSPPSVMIGYGTHMPLASVGSVCTSHLSLSDAYCISKFIINLGSLSQLCDSNDYVS